MIELDKLVIHNPMFRETYSVGHQGVSSITRHYLGTTEYGVEEEAPCFCIVYDNGKMITWNLNHVSGYEEVKA